ncbi:antibiotic biosynthesis monooxygenase [Acetobacter sp. TBRC 12305]|uniref:Antibiotic biosynthesis monooxygenase n=1 Tax=Acetobacter garciniae TaxID=2817435 RepID=A0A939HLC5_9PROT|nr:putative quinol monooxygenase [Acetobacter garciniae]MBO1326563.1 antibiotic biosynthesis monooxygenase [Acetobacter garciniae]MBX0346254.1 antibiotic biosynthesis monooxygenase [Acetobacter garciniae]
MPDTSAHTSAKPVTIIASFRLKPEAVDHVLPIVAECIRQSRKESANRFYTCRQDSQDPLHFVFIEQWQSLETQREHELKPHFLAMKAAFSTALAAPMDVTFLFDTDRLP